MGTFDLKENRQTYGKQVKLTAQVSDELLDRLEIVRHERQMSKGEVVWEAANEYGQAISDHYLALYGSEENRALMRGRRTARVHKVPYRTLFFYLPASQKDELVALAHSVGAKSISDLVSRLLRLYLGLPLPNTSEPHDPT